ncbi:MAG: hypothetical protein J6Y11_03345 [Paludibacteraceae bacterium]|nr:hypothetical protein [Paludibacteraceae bacterium]
MKTILDDRNLYLIIVTIYEILLFIAEFHIRVLDDKASWNLTSLRENREPICFIFGPLILASLVIWGMSRIVYFDLRIPYIVICFLHFAIFAVFYFVAPYGKYVHMYPIVNLVLLVVMVCSFYIREIINIIQNLFDFIK